jgi:hypothetical protein
VGNISHPLPTIGRGLAAAEALSLHEVHVASRGAAVDDEHAYIEPIDLVAGVSLVGGYDPANFEAPPSLANHPTVIANDALVMVSGFGLTARGAYGTVLRGFHLLGQGTVLNRIGIDIGTADASLLIEDIHLDMGVSTRSSTGIRLAHVDGGVFARSDVRMNTMTSVEPPLVEGVRVDDGAPVIRGNTIDAGLSLSATCIAGNPSVTFYASAIHLLQSAGVYERNTFIGGRFGHVTTCQCVCTTRNIDYWTLGMHVDSFRGERPVVRDNLVVMPDPKATVTNGSFGGLSWGVGVGSLGATPGPILANNTVVITAGSPGQFVNGYFGNRATLVNNLFAAIGPSAGSIAFYNSQVIPDAFLHNAFAGFENDYQAGPSPTTFAVLEDALLDASNPVGGNWFGASADLLQLDADSRPQACPDDPGAYPGRFGGFDTRSDACGPSGDEPCGAAVPELDVDGTPRTCPGVGTCMSIGAYEMENPC